MDFEQRRAELADRNWNDPTFRKAATDWHDISRTFLYQYMFEWMGRPIIQDPQDICGIQEIIWRIQPRLVIETGVARGGSLALSAGILAAISHGEWLRTGHCADRRVIGIDIEIRPHNRAALETHPLSPMMTLIEGSSVDEAVVAQVKDLASEKKPVLVMLDSNHTHDHVLSEIRSYAPLVTTGSAIFVMDTGIEFALESSLNSDRPWRAGNNPLTAVKAFLNSPEGADFETDRSIEQRYLITCAPEGLLIRRG